MKLTDHQLHTPIYAKLNDDDPWPEDESVFYLLTRDGLFLSRNHEFFRSSVPTEKGSGELAGHESFIKLSYPKIPQQLFEQVIGYFSKVADLHGAEAAVLLVWNRETEQVEAIAPPQRSTVSKSWDGQRVYPIDVHYEVPVFPPHLVPIGDVHSHVRGPAYASLQDIDDEVYRPGLHIVVGRIDEEPPELHIEVTVDGKRFAVASPSEVIEGYQSRREDEVPDEWMDQLTVEEWVSQYYASTTNAAGSGNGYQGGYQGNYLGGHQGGYQGDYQDDYQT